MTANTAFELPDSIRQILQMGSAMRAHDLADYFRTDSTLIDHALQIVLRSGRVETLKPVGNGNESENSVYYRWKKDHDDMYTWQHLLWCRRHNPRHRINHLVNAPA